MIQIKVTITRVPGLMVLLWKISMEISPFAFNQLLIRIYKMAKYITKSNGQDLKYIDITITMNGNTNRVSWVPFDMVTKSVTPVT